MASAIRHVATAEGLAQLSIPQTTEALDAALYTLRNPQWTAPQILVRTSGVSRISDYLLWQIVEQTAIFVLPCFWPDIGVADVVPVLLAWQAHIIVTYMLKLFSLAT